MKPVIELILLLLLAVTFVQDYKYRAVSWYVFPMLILVAVLLNVQSQNNTAAYRTYTIFNVIWLSIQLLLLSIYFSLKEKSWVNITKKYLGWGDVLFLFSLCFIFSTMNLIIFYLLSLTGVIVYLLIPAFQKKYTALMQIKIPLAGIQALMLAVLMVVNKIAPFMNFGQDIVEMDFLIR